MKYKNLLTLLKKAIEYKRSHKIVEEIANYFKEDGEITKKGYTKLTTKNKREQLKLAYSRILSNTPYKSVLPMFKQLIDQVPESYLDYELGIDLDKSMDMISELLHGTGLLTAEELGNLNNIVNGIGVPAIEHHAAGKKEMSGETAKFGSENINKNLGQFFDSLNTRRNPKNKIATTALAKPVPTTSGVPVKIEEPVRKYIVRLFKMPKIASNSAFGKIVSKMQAAMPDVAVNTDRLTDSIASIIQNSSTQKDAEEKVKKTLHIDVANDQFFTDMYREAMRAKQEQEIKK